jgi:hypothetical protein
MMTGDVGAVAAWLIGRPELTTQAPLVTADFPKPLILAGVMPADPDRCISLMSYPGPQPPNNWQLDGRIQIMVRGCADGKGRAPQYDASLLCDAIERLVAPAKDQRQVITLPGGRQAALKLATDRAPIGYDGSNRYQYTINLGLDSVRA